MTESGEPFRQLIEVSPVAMLIVNDIDGIVFANRAAIRLYGAETLDDLAGRNTLDLVHPDDRGEIKSRRHDVLQGARPPISEDVDLRFDGRRMRLDGSIFLSESRGIQIVWNGTPSVLLIIRDITRRKQAEDALRESEEQLRAIIDNSPSIIYLRDTDANLVRVNKTYEKFYNITQEEAAGQRGHQWLGEELAQTLIGGDRDVLATGKVKEIEFQFVDSAGSTHWMRSVKFPVMDDRQQVVGVGGSTTEITEQKNAELALRESEEMHRDLIEGAVLATQIVSHTGKRLYFNQAFLDLYGYDTKEEASAQDRIGAFTAPSDRERITQFSKFREAKDPRVHNVEFNALKKDGSTFPVHSFIRPITWEGEYAQQRIYVDLSNRREAEKELETQKLFFETLVENIPASVTMKDLDGKYLFVNRMICEASNRTPEDIVGKTAMEAFGIESDSVYSEISRTAMATGKPVFGVERKSELDEQRTVSSSFVPIKRADGKMVSLLTISFDITEHRQREEQLHQSQKMEAVGQLTGGVAHDFNNLLTIVLGNLELLADHVAGDETATGYAVRAISGAQKGADLTHLLLAFSRKQTLLPAIIDPHELVEGMSHLMRRTLGEMIEIEVLASEGLWRCEVDPTQLESAILNLAINARDAMANGGKLTIKTENVHFGDNDPAALPDVAPGRYVMVSVTDTGAGIPAEAMGHVFEPFFTTKEIGKGSGMGLSMVYGFVKQSGGHVTIDSEEGVGTTVKMYLPRSVATSVQSLPVENGTAPRARGETVLVVEDDADVRALAVDVLGELGYETIEAADGDAAIEVLGRAPGIDLLFTDVVLPGGLSGADIALEALHRNPGIKVLYVSGYADDILSSQAGLDANVQLINKPYRKGDLAEKMRAVLDGTTA